MTDLAPHVAWNDPDWLAQIRRSAFERYAALEPDARKADRALFAVARVWKGAQNLRAQEKAYNVWRAKYGDKPENADDYVFSYWDMAKQWEKSGNTKEANKAKAATLQAWVKVGSPQNEVASDLAAASTKCGASSSTTRRTPIVTHRSTSRPSVNPRSSTWRSGSGAWMRRARKSALPSSRGRYPE